MATLQKHGAKVFGLLMDLAGIASFNDDANWWTELLKSVFGEQVHYVAWLLLLVGTVLIVWDVFFRGREVLRRGTSELILAPHPEHVRRVPVQGSKREAICCCMAVENPGRRSIHAAARIRFKAGDAERVVLTQDAIWCTAGSAEKPHGDVAPGPMVIAGGERALVFVAFAFRHEERLRAAGRQLLTTGCWDDGHYELSEAAYTVELELTGGQEPIEHRLFLIGPYRNNDGWQQPDLLDHDHFG